MNIKRIHYTAGITIAVFIGLHLINHCFSFLGAEKHIEVMTTLRLLYRNAFVETILLLAITTQLYSGLKLFKTKRRTAHTFFERLQIWTGLYLAIFFVIHLGAVLAGRFVLHLDTNIYFGVAGLNTFPFNLFFIPYYALAIVSFFGHCAAAHHQRIKKSVFGVSPYQQSILIFIIGIGLALFLIYALTNRFQGFQIPSEYNILVGK